MASHIPNTCGLRPEHALELPAAFEKFREGSMHKGKKPHGVSAMRQSSVSRGSLGPE